MYTRFQKNFLKLHILTHFQCNASECQAPCLLTTVCCLYLSVDCLDKIVQLQTIKIEFKKCLQIIAALCILHIHCMLIRKRFLKPGFGFLFFFFFFQKLISESSLPKALMSAANEVVGVSEYIMALY